MVRCKQNGKEPFVLRKRQPRKVAQGKYIWLREGLFNDVDMPFNLAFQVHKMLQVLGAALANKICKIQVYTRISSHAAESPGKVVLHLMV